MSHIRWRLLASPSCSRFGRDALVILSPAGAALRGMSHLAPWRKGRRLKQP